MLWLFSGLFVTTHWIGLFTNFSAVLSGLAVPKPPSLMGTVMTTSARFSISVSCRNSSSGRVSTSGIAAELRPPCTCEGPLWWRSFLCNSASRRRNVSLCHYGCRNQFMGRRYGNRLARQVICDLRYTLELFTWFSPNYTTKMALQNPLKISHLNGIFLRKQFLLLFSKNGVEELA